MFRHILVLAIATFSTVASEARAAPRLTVVPPPRETWTAPGVTRLGADWAVCVEGGLEDSTAVEGLLSDARVARGWRWSRTNHRGPRSIVVRPRPAFGAGIPLLEAQGYDLTIAGDSITIAAPTSTGRYYGVQTLRQLLRGSRDTVLPRVKIRDYPALAWRGVSDDISRGQVPRLRDVRATLEHLGFYKINLYCLYIEDGARFWSAPEVGMDRDALTPSALRLITEEARRYHITVMPIFETLGHQERLLARPEFVRYSERPRPSRLAEWLNRSLWSAVPAVARALSVPDPDDRPAPATCFAVSSPGTRTRVAELVDEIAASTPSPFFHLGGDEPADLGTGASQSDVARRGRGAVYADYMRALAKHVETHLGRQPVIFGDVLLEDLAAMSAIPKTTAIMDWHYDPRDDGASLHRLVGAGYRTVFASPGLWNWFAIYPDYSRAFPNITNLARAAKREGVAGLVVCSWGDGGAESLRRANWTGYAYTAYAAWGSSDSTGFFDRFVPAEYGVTDPGLGRAEHLIGWQEFPTMPSNQKLFHWAPRVRGHDERWVGRMTALQQNMTEARSLIGAAYPAVRFGRERLDVLDHVAARFQYVAQRELVMERLARTLGDRPWNDLNTKDRHDGERALEELGDSLSAVTTRYELLWKRDNRAATLGPLLDRLRGQRAALDRLLDQARQGSLRAAR